MTTKHGEAVAVVIDHAAYERLVGAEITFVDYLGHHGTMPDDFEINRVNDAPREIDLTA